jgi:catechol 2,3-dioxygenase-like lactoylglutathione lyase family enzyme
MLSDLRFCHLVVGVTDMDRALSFYRGLLGMDVVFDQLISGESFDAALHASRQQEGRVVGGLIGGLMIELLSLGARGDATSEHSSASACASPPFRLSSLDS